MNGNMSALLSALTDSISTEDLLLAHFTSDIAVAISTKRVELGMTQKEFAEMLGKTQAIVSKWENGDANFTLKTLVEIAEKLDLELNVSLKSQSAPARYMTDSKRVEGRRSIYSYRNPGYQTRIGS